MELGIAALLALGLVFAMGAALMELLFLEAPRRGKRPDIHDDARNAETILRVTTTDGDIVVGKPLFVVRELILQGFAPSPKRLTVHTAERTLDVWEQSGMVKIRGEWAE